MKPCKAELNDHISSAYYYNYHVDDDDYDDNDDDDDDDDNNNDGDGDLNKTIHEIIDIVLKTK